MIATFVVTMLGIFGLVCAVHPSGSDNETCDDYEHDPETEAILYKDFLGVGEFVEIEDTINNPYLVRLQNYLLSIKTRFSKRQ